MILGLIILGIAIISVVLSYFSLRSDMKKQKHVAEVQKKLAKGRVIYYSPTSSSRS